MTSEMIERELAIINKQCIQSSHEIYGTDNPIGRMVINAKTKSDLVWVIIFAFCYGKICGKREEREKRRRTHQGTERMPK